MAAFGLSPQQEIIFSILSYSLCSGSLVLVNKLTLHYLPFPSLVVTVQLVACIIMIYSANMLGKITVDPIKWEFVKPYLLYTVFFSTGVYCNMRSLNISNVETVIVFRALSPALVAFMDALLLGREWPSKRSWVGLLTLVVGAYGYASYDEKFQTQGASAYYWPSIYTVIIALEMVCHIRRILIVYYWIQHIMCRLRNYTFLICFPNSLSFFFYILGLRKEDCSIRQARNHEWSCHLHQSLGYPSYDGSGNCRRRIQQTLDLLVGQLGLPHSSSQHSLAHYWMPYWNWNWIQWLVVPWCCLGNQFYPYWR